LFDDDAAGLIGNVVHLFPVFIVAGRQKSNRSYKSKQEVMNHFIQRVSFSDDTSVKTYADQNKHLPEVLPAKEMEANGINLSGMNMLLLR
jgi:hypothetical protein